MENIHHMLHILLYKENVLYKMVVNAPLRVEEPHSNPFGGGGIEMQAPPLLNKNLNY